MSTYPTPMPCTHLKSPLWKMTLGNKMLLPVFWIFQHCRTGYLLCFYPPSDKHQWSVKIIIGQRFESTHILFHIPIHSPNLSSSSPVVMGKGSPRFIIVGCDFEQDLSQNFG
jgi:hypothetical protein